MYLNLPIDLTVLSFKAFHHIVYHSITGRIFVNFYYECGHYSDSITIELSEEEITTYNCNPTDFIEIYVKKVSADYDTFKKRNIRGFNQLDKAILARKFWLSKK